MADKSGNDQIRESEILEQLDGWKQVAQSGSFEEAMNALETIVAALDEGEMSLAASIDSYEVGAALVSRCSDLLEDARVRVTTLSTDSSTSQPESGIDD